MKKIIISCLILIILVVSIITISINWKDKNEENYLTPVTVAEPTLTLMDGQCKKIIKMIYDTSNDQKDIIIKTTSFLNFENNTKDTTGLGNQIQSIRRKKESKYLHLSLT